MRRWRRSASMPVSGKALPPGTSRDEPSRDPYRRPAFFPRDGDVPEERHDARRLHLSGLAGQRRGAAGGVSEILHGRLCEDGARVRWRRTGRHRIAAMAEDRHRIGLGHRGGLRDLCRQDDCRASRPRQHSTASISACTAPWRCAACRGPRPNWRGGSARRSGRRPSSPRPSICTATRTRRSCDHADMAFAVKYFPHYDEYLQGERAARTLVRAIRGDYKPTHVTHPRSRHLADGAAMDRRIAVDGSGAARAGLGGARARRLCEHLLRLSVCRRA